MMKYFSTVLSTLFIGMLWLTPYLIQAQTPELIADGQPHEEPFTGSYIDYKIPSAADLGGLDHIEFHLTGGDGGKRKVPGLCLTKGGGGATAVVRFEIGTGSKMLRPGGRIRFIVGGKGESNRGSGIEGGGGGGATAVLYIKPGVPINAGCQTIFDTDTFNLPSLDLADANSCVVVLAIAGGGGGAYSSGVCGGSAGKGGNDKVNGTDGKGLGAGKGGNGGRPGNCGGGGRIGYSNCINNQGGGSPGGFYGANGANSSQDGGFGYGSGAGGATAGGGGGGYSGGGDGASFDGGGGGGSFVNHDAKYKKRTAGGTDGTPDNGSISYIFKDLDTNTPDARCKDITVALDANGTVKFPADSSDAGSVDPLGGNLAFCYFAFFSCPDTLNWDCSRLGDNTLLLAVGNGVEGDGCTSIVTVEDTIPPTAICKDITVGIDPATNTASLAPSDVNDGSNDNCSIENRYIDRAGFTCQEEGVHTVTLSLDDKSDNTSSCTASVTITSPPPVAVCNDVTLNLTSFVASVSGSMLTAGSSDNCGLKPNTQTYSFTCSDIGQNPVSLTVRELTGNASASCTAIVTVTEKTPPTALCQSTTVYLDASGIASVIPSDVDNGSYDNCGVPTFTAHPLSFDCTATGSPQTVTLTVTDPSGNTAMCTDLVTVEDTISPTFSCPSNETLNTVQNCVSLGSIAPGFTDNCTGGSWEISFSGNPNGVPADLTGLAQNTGYGPFTYELGTTSVTLTGMDAAGNAAANCSFTVTVVDDDAPTLACPSNQAFENDTKGCTVSYTIPDPLSDNCSGATWGATFSGNANGVPFPFSGRADGSDSPSLTFERGTTTISLSGIDAAGNAATPCSFTITLIDTSPPALICPPDITVGNDPDQCGAIVHYSVTGIDNCFGGVLVLQTDATGLSSGDEFPVGTTTLTYEVTDASGNTGSCRFDITVNDTTPPIIKCPADKVLTTCPNSCKSCLISFTIRRSDNCSLLRNTGVSRRFWVGMETLTYNARDAAGNTSTCSFTVTVRDNKAPTISCPADITVDNDLGTCGAVVDYTVTSDDNCSVSHVQTDMTGRKSGDAFPVGSTLQSFEATDASGNTATCSFTITVNDTENPVFACPTGNVVRNADPGMCDHLAVGQDLDPDVSDNCQLQSVTNDYNSGNSLAGAVFSKGKTLVTWTATDIHGNSSTCSYHIKIRDREAPIFDNCPDDTTLIIPAFTGGSYFTWNALAATDNCNAPHKLTITGFPLSGSFFSLGTTIVTWTATDKSNNVGVCEFEVTVEEDGLDAPSGWASQGLGSASGCHTHYDTTTQVLTVQSSGGNVSMAADNFCGITIPNSQSVIDFRARVTPAGGSYYDQAGIMMRQSLATNSAHATMLLTGTSVPLMSMRTTAGAFPLSTAGTAVSKPYWLRLYRFGSTITGYVSADGVNWSVIMSYPNLLSSPLYLVLFSTTSGPTGQATFDHITINGAAVRLGAESIGTELNLKAHPNPFSEDLFIHVENALPGETYQVRLSNILGQRIYGYETGASAEGRIEQRISLEYLPAGTYLLEVEAGVQRKAIKVQKF